MSTHECTAVQDDMAGLVDGDAACIAKHAEHLVGCEVCRDARYEAERAGSAIARAGDDHVGVGAALVARVMAAVDEDAARGAVRKLDPRSMAPTRSVTPGTPGSPGAPMARTRSVTPAKAGVQATSRDRSRSSRGWAVAAAVSAVAAVGIGTVAVKHRSGAGGLAPTNGSTGTDGVATRSGAGTTTGDTTTTATTAGLTAASDTVTVERIERAAPDQTGGLTATVGGAERGLAAGATVPVGAVLKTDPVTRVALVFADGTHVTLDQSTQLTVDAAEPRRMKLASGRLVADVVHLDHRPAAIETPSGRIDVVGTRFALAATDSLTAVQVVRGTVKLVTPAAAQDVRAGEEGIVDRGALSVAATPNLVRETEWAELGLAPARPDETTAGLGALRAYKPGEQRDRDWNLVLAKHDVKVRIVGPIARTEITETFRNDSDATLEGVYQFPMPADAQIDELALDVKDGFEQGAFVDKVRAGKIFQGVIDKATPHAKQRPESDIIWVQGPWRDPALLDWQRGGRFQLKVYPIPAKGARTIKIAYTQVVAPRGAWRQYVYPLPHSRDGSTVADDFTVDVEVRGADPQHVRTTTYDLVADPARQAVAGYTLHAPGFVPRGDLAIEYRAADGDAELRAWAFAGGSALAPDEVLAAKTKVGNDPAVLAAQRLAAQDARPVAVIALRPKLPRWESAKPRDYVIAVDTSQSMVGERASRVTALATSLVEQMDRRDRFTVLACDSACRVSGVLRPATIADAALARTWLGAQAPAGASDVVGAVRAAIVEVGADATRERWVLYVGDGFATTGFRRAADVERAIAASTAATTGVRVATIGIGSDADATLLAAAARGGGGSYLAWHPGESVATVAAAGLESTVGSALRDARIELPAGLSDVAPTVLPTIRAGEEIFVAARLDQAAIATTAGDVILRGTVGGQAFEQHYALALTASTAAGNAFVPRLWAALAIDQLERSGDAGTRARIVALSQGYGVMSRETSLLVLESSAMFDAYGIDHRAHGAAWTGEDALDEQVAGGTLAMADAAGDDDALADKNEAGDEKAKADAPSASMGAATATPTTRKPTPAPATKPASAPSDRAARRPAIDGDMVFDARGRGMVPMRRTWVKVPSVSAFGGVSPSITKAIADAETALAAAPDSRERHRALVQALSYGGELDRAKQVAARWLERDRMDPQALAYTADLLGREGQRDLALRTLDGLVDLDADRVALHERMIRAYEQVGQLSLACGHRIAIAALQPAAPAGAGAAVRCLRSLGRRDDAELVLRALDSSAIRAAAEKAALVDAAAAPAARDLVIAGRWDGGEDLDISLVAPDGSRISWMGGRLDASVTDATSATGERLGLRALKRGNYLVEISRLPSMAPVHGTLDIKALGLSKSVPFELATGRTVVARINVALEAHLERVWE